MDDALVVALPRGMSIRPLVTTADAFRAHDVLSEVWGGDASGMPPNLLRALAHLGTYTVGLYDGDDMVGASVAFFAAPGEHSMHSHITGILPAYRGRNLGHAVKLHQRRWALRHGVDTITWTFDPLVARNAHFNLCALGARVAEYLVDFYGPMDDGVNRGDESDRLLVTWDLTAPLPVDVPSGGVGPRRVAPGGVGPGGVAPDGAMDVRAVVAVPRDIEGLRRVGSPEAASWRMNVRAAFLAHHAAGLVVGGFDDERGYLFVRDRESGRSSV